MQDIAHLVVSGFYEERIPQFRQGMPKHELEEVVGAEDCKRWVQHIAALESELATKESECRQLVGEVQRHSNRYAVCEQELANTRAVLRELVEAVEELRRFSQIYTSAHAANRLDRALAAAREVK